METTTLVQIIGPMLAVVAIGFLFNPKSYRNMMQDFEKHEGTIYLAGLFSMLIGLIIVLNHNIWEFSVAGVITFIGWGAVVKGIILILHHFSIVDRGRWCAIGTICVPV